MNSMEDTQTQTQTPSLEDVAVDFSSLDEFVACPASYHWHIERGLVSVGVLWEPALLFGEGIHAARHALAEGNSVDKAIEVFDAVYGVQYEQYADINEKRTPYVGHSLIHAYQQKWGTPQDETHTEVGASVEIDRHLVYYGRIDYVRGEGPYNTVVDLKTTSSLIWLPKAQLNWQLIGYAHMMQVLTGIKVHFVEIDGVVVPMRLAKKILEAPPPEWELALTLHDNLHRRNASVQEGDYLKWMTWVQYYAQRIRECRESGVWPMNAPKACNRYRRECAYMPLCTAQSDEQREKLVGALYKVERWHPYE